ncbi:MAG: bifunctional nuclease domain-containing protein [Thermaurantimonas sp.]|uniref:bifunctional nuclease family protein n=1 Tax=Thermaurantimonas sp. TaxID=2681568 RepID=UPI00391983A5
MTKVQLFLKGLSYSQTHSGAYALVLGEDEQNIRLPIIIGGFEAQSIAMAVENEMKVPRPLTHDLFKKFAETFGIEIVEVVIHKLEEGVFYSYIVCTMGGREEILDARPSDAVALAIRFNCPIYTTEEILAKAGVVIDDPDKPKPKSAPKASSDESSSSNLSNKSIEQLKKMLQKAVEAEDYEYAARIRDEMSKRGYSGM